VFQGHVTVFGKVVDGIELLDKLRVVPINRETKQPLVNVYIKSTLVIDDPFPEEQINFEEPTSPTLPKVNQKEPRQSD
jgi:hypothetical protein